MKNRPLLTPWSRQVVQLVGVAGAIAFLAALRFAPHRALAAFLLGNVYFTMLAATALAFIAIQNVAGAGWPIVLRRVPEAMTAYLPAGALLMLVVLAGSHSLYHWAHAEAMVHDPVLHAKAGYLNLPAWSVRGALILALWWGFSRALLGHSRRQDADGDEAHTHASRRLSAIFLVVFGVTFTLASIDWVMSLEPHWYSTIFAWYMFGGAFVSTVAVVAILTVLLSRRGLLEGVNEHHRHDLGKYLFAFGVFWAYLWFSQYLLIWYSNIPEETAYFVLRSSRGWIVVQGLSLLANFLLPAGLLLRASAKKEEGSLLAAATSLCAGRWLDLYAMVMPSTSPSAAPHWVDAPVFIGLAALFVLLFERSFSSAAPVPLKDPYLAESLHHHG